MHNMSNKKNILIIEDEIATAKELMKKLTALNYMVAGITCNLSESLTILERKNVNVALVGIRLSNSEDIVELVMTIKNRFNLQVIFISSHSDKKMVSRAVRIQPDGYIEKPFRLEDIYAAVEGAKNKIKPENDHCPNCYQIMNKPQKEYIFVKKNDVHVKVEFKWLIWIKSDGNYLELFCFDNNFLIRASLKEFMKKLPPEKFIQVHKSHCVNIEYINSVGYNFCNLTKNINIPIGRSFLENVKACLSIEGF